MISAYVGPDAPQGRQRLGAAIGSRRGISNLFACAILALALGACAETAGIQPTSAPSADGQSGATNRPVLAQFNDIFVPPGSKIYVENTLVFGTDPWYGRLVLGASQDMNTVFDLYRRDMPGLGWQEVTSIRAPISILTYLRDNRVMTVQLQRTTLGGSEITLTSSPRETGKAGNGPAPAPSYPPQQAPVTRIR